MVKRTSPPKLTAERAREVLAYDPVTGLFSWRKRLSRGTQVGKETGCVNKIGYKVIRIDRELYLAHRVAWLWVTGEWPPEQIDHIDLDRGNNAWANLRPATNAENNCNVGLKATNTHGRKGIYFDKRSRRWCARIRANGKNHWLGSSRLPDVAKAKYDAAAKRMHGEFARLT